MTYSKEEILNWNEDKNCLKTRLSGSCFLVLSGSCNLSYSYHFHWRYYFPCSMQTKIFSSKTKRYLRPYHPECARSHPKQKDTLPKSRNLSIKGPVLLPGGQAPLQHSGSAVSKKCQPVGLVTTAFYWWQSTPEGNDETHQAKCINEVWLHVFSIFKEISAWEFTWSIALSNRNIMPATNRSHWCNFLNFLITTI
jgi:hypothetical protein